MIVRVLAPANRPPTATDGTVEVEAGTIGSVALDAFVTDPDLATGDVLSFELLDATGDVTLDGSTVPHRRCRSTPAASTRRRAVPRHRPGRRDAPRRP